MSENGRERHNGAAPPRQTSTGNGTVAEHVAEIQRQRMLAAMTQAACERGAGNVTVANVVERAGVSRRTFYEIFQDSEDCLLAALDEAVLRVRERVVPAYEDGGRWHERMRAGLTALLRLLEEEPQLARLLVVESLGGGRRSLERRTEVLGPVVGAVEEGRQAAKIDAPPLACEGVVGAVLSVLHGRMLEGRTEGLVEFVNPLMSMIVLPYLGAAAARRELAQPVPDPLIRAKAAEGNPLKALRMRLTYRTVRVLSAVATHPASSNRCVAQAAGITDQGQISKLLARLEKLGLIENTSPGNATRGEPNAWALTASGEEVHASIAHV